MKTSTSQSSQQLSSGSNSTEWEHMQRSPMSAHFPLKVSTILLTLSKPQPSPTNLSTANVLWNLKNLICQHASIICSITVRDGGGGPAAPGEGWRVVKGLGQLLSDGKTALWLGPHAGWNCPGQPRNQIINSDTRHSVSRLRLAWKFWYGSISNLSPFFTISQGFINLCVCLCQGIRTSLLPCHPVPQHTPPPLLLCRYLKGTSHRDLLKQAPDLLTPD